MIFHCSILYILYNYYVIGPASVVCAETLRQEGFRGKIILCCREKTLPYDRPKITKVHTTYCMSGPPGMFSDIDTLQTKF